MKTKTFIWIAKDATLAWTYNYDFHHKMWEYGFELLGEL